MFCHNGNLLKNIAYILKKKGVNTAMKKTALLFIIMLIILGGSRNVLYAFQEETGQEKREDKSEEIRPEGRDYTVNLSIYYPFSINKTKEDRVNFNLSLVYGHVGYISGFDMSLFASAVSHRMDGVQLCGLIAVAGESGSGFQASGLITVAGEEFTGVQLGGLLCVSGERFKGWQTSGLISVIGESGSGVQVSGLASVCGENYTGVQIGGFNVIGERGYGGQISALFSVTGEDFDGLQISGLFNVTGEVFKGIQIGSFNVAAENQGIQVGVANVGDTSSGLQIGVVNYMKRENSGIPVGMVNIARNGRIGAVLWGGNNVAVNAGIKFVINRVYSILSLGAINLDNDISTSFTYGFHYGLDLSAGKLKIYPDIGFRYRDNKPLFKENALEQDQYMFEARFSLGIPVSDRITLLVGGGYCRSKDTDRGSMAKDSALIFAGMEIF